MGTMYRARSSLLMLLCCCGCADILGLDDYGSSSANGMPAGAGGSAGHTTGGNAGSGGTVEPSHVVWVKAFGDTGRSEVTDVAVKPDGSIVIVGTFDDLITFDV